MVLRDHSFKKVWDSDEDDIVSDFFLPALSSATLYQRVAGYFSSTVLAIAARGIKNLLDSGGKMQLVCGCQLSQQDKEAMEKGSATTEFNDKFLEELNSLEDGDFRKNHVQILGWMIKNKKLEIKIAEVDDPIGIYHMKIGIISDDNDLITFSGSINESANGWEHSAENFDAFVSWGDDSEKEHIEGHEKIFQKYWNDQGNKTRVFSLPDAISKELIRIAPEDYRDIELHEESDKRETFEPHDHQTDALEAWRNNDFKGIFDVATGGGKTFTAILGSDLAPKHVITIIIVPRKLLQDQWINELRTHVPHSHIIKIGGDKPNQDWEDTIRNLLFSYGDESRKESITKRTYVVITNASATTDAFVDLWRKCNSSDVQLIADEVHNLGTDSSQSIFEIPCERRIGLSATYRRQWDPAGSQRIENFFGGLPVFTYTIGQAIADGHLSHYVVHHCDVELTEREWNKFHELTRSIGQAFAIKEQARKNNDVDGEHRQIQIMKHLAEERADIVKSAENKIPVLDTIIPKISWEEKTIVFCAETEQLLNASEILQNHNKTHRQYSTTLGLSDDALNQHLKEFNGDDAKYLVGIDCLNEGLDIQTCTTCILMSSSATEREYVQRRGRILRLGGATDVAHIYDMIVYPPSGLTANQDNQNTIRALLEHELRRSDIICEAADNIQDIETHLEQKFRQYGTTLTNVRNHIQQVTP